MLIILVKKYGQIHVKLGKDELIKIYFLVII